VVICDRVVFFQLCDVPTLASKTLQEELDNFGYKPKKKVQSFQNPPIIWQPVEPYCLDMGKKKIPSKSGDFGAFLPSKVLCTMLHSIFVL